jgi:serine/threonine-protein kinase
MVTSDLGACDGFVWELRRSNLLDRGQLDQIVGEFLKRSPRAEPPALAEYLVKQNLLSAFQAERVLAGKSQGLVLGPYNLIDAIGSGSMGQVYKASSKADDQWYAVKVLPRRSMWNVRLARRQVRSFAQFTHPSVVPFVDVGTSGGMHYLVWPMVEGETLDAVLQREGKFSPEQTAQVGLMIANGLNVCHQHGLFHGLLKPSNVMISPDGTARILDFGIGSLLVENEGESLVDTMSTANALTSGLDCSSPESIMEPTNRTPAGDQYSLGCTLYYCLSGRYPFPDGSAVEKMMAHQFKQPTPIRELAPGAPEALLAVIEKLMQKAPEARYAGADEVVEALQPVAGRGAKPHEAVRSNSTPTPTRRPSFSNLQMPAVEPERGKPGSAPGFGAPAPQPALKLPTRGTLLQQPAAPAPAPAPAYQPAPTSMTPPGWVPHPVKQESGVSPVLVVAAAGIFGVLAWMLSMMLLP